MPPGYTYMYKPEPNQPKSSQTQAKWSKAQAKSSQTPAKSSNKRNHDDYLSGENLAGAIIKAF